MWWTDTVDDGYPRRYFDVKERGRIRWMYFDTVDVNSYILTYDYTDAAGNAAVQVSRTVNVVDTTIPVITLTGEATVTHEGATAYTDEGADWTDTVDGSGTLTASGTVDANTVGTYILTYDYTDAAGNAAVQVSRAVNVVDTTIPVISLTGEATVTHEGATAYTDEGADWTDTVDGSGTLTASGTVDVDTVGTYILTYDYTDAAGNAAVQVSRTVNVVDTTIPVITLTGEATVTHEGATAYTDEGAGWTDTVDGSGTLTASGTVDVNTVGTYILSYDYTDAAGNAAVQVSRTVNVVDTTIPVITLNGEAEVSHQVWVAYEDAGAEATDSVDGNLTASLQVTSTVDINQPGEYSVLYELTDASGNAAVSLTRTVTVFNTDPTGLELSSLEVEENLPAGTEVGVFSTDDPDDPEGNRTYSYSIVGGSGEASFRMGAGGVLQTAEVFDYENQTEYELRIRSTDAFGGILEQNVSIGIVDCFHAIVDTGAVSGVSESAAVLNGEVLDEGGLSGVTERGFLVSTRPEVQYGAWGVLQVYGGTGSGTFSKEVKNLESGEKYFARAYALNAEGDCLWGE